MDKGVRRQMTNGEVMTEYGSPDRKGRRKSYKSRWIARGDGTEERLIVKFDPASRYFMLNTIKKRVEHAESIIKNPSKLSLSRCSDGKEHIKKIAVDRNGEVVRDRSELVLSKEKIEEGALAGYCAYVTDIPSKGDSDEEYRESLRRDGLRCVLRRKYLAGSTTNFIFDSLRKYELSNRCQNLSGFEAVRFF